MGLEEVFLDSRIRRAFQNPYAILQHLDLKSGETFLDVGCGTGFLTIPAARLVGEEGRVYAVDNNPRYLQKLAEKLRKHGLNNVTIFNTEAEKMENIEENSIDKAVMLLSLHHFQDKEEALRRTYEKLVGGGLLMIVEPIRKRMLGHGTEPAEILRYLASIGYEVVFYEKRLLTWRAILRK